MTCPNCQRVNPPEAQFCGCCGAELAVPAPTPTDAGPPMPAPAPRPSQQGRHQSAAGVWQRVVLGLASLVLLLLGGLSSTRLAAGWSYFDLGMPPLVVRLRLGIAAARPPRGRIYRPILVSVACLVLLLVAAVVVFIIWLLFQFR